MALINGENIPVKGISVLAYLRENGYLPERVVVERNREILDRDRLDAVMIEDGDEIEILNFVGGG